MLAALHNGLAIPQFSSRWIAVFGRDAGSDGHYTLSADGTVTRREYVDPSAGAQEALDTSGQAWKVTINASPSSLASAFPGYSGLPTSSTGPSLEYTTTRDALGRVRRSSSPGPSGPITSDWTYGYTTIEGDTASDPGRVGVRYMTYKTFPFRLTDQTYTGPVSIVWSDAQEGALSVRRMAPVVSSSAAGDILPRNVLTTGTGSGTDETHLATYLGHRGVDGLDVGRSTSVLSLAGLVKSVTGFHDVANTWSRGAADRSYTESYEYDGFGRRTKYTSAQGTVSEDVYDVLGRIVERKYGTESGLSTAAKFYYDWNGTGTPQQGVGNGNLTISVGNEDATTTRVRQWYYDNRDRVIRIINPLPPHQAFAYDNLDRVVESAEFSAAPSGDINSSLTSRGRYVSNSYSQRGMLYRTRVAVDPQEATDGVTPTSGFLETHVWYDPMGRAIEVMAPDAPAKKTTYDSLGRVTATYVTDRGGDGAPGSSTAFGAASTLTGDIVFEQTEYKHADYGPACLVRQVVRRHDDSSTTGALTYGSSPTGVASYLGYVYDEAMRPIRTVVYGTNRAPGTSTSSDRLSDTFANGTDPSSSWPMTTVPNWNDSGFENHIVSAVVYGRRGTVSETIDTLGRRSRTEYDDLNRAIVRIENYTGAASGPTISWNSAHRWNVSVNPVYPATSLAADSNRVTSFAHFHDSTAGGGWIQRQVAHAAPGGGGSSGAVQVTDSVYGVEKSTATTPSPTDSLISSADWLREVRYSSASSGLTLGPSDTGYEKNRVYYGYNALGEMRGVVDQNITTHAYTRDALGRVLSDQVTFNPSPGLGAPVVDQRVGAITAAYDNFGRLADVKSLGTTSGTPVVDHVQYNYDRLDRITSVVQDPDSAIGATAYQHAPRTVGYGYETAKFSTSGSIGNRSRLSKLDYPIIPLASTANPGQTSLRYTRGEALGLGASFASKNEAIGRVTGLWLDEWYGEEGTGLGPIVQYDYVGLSMIAHKDLALADIALDRTVDSTGRRQYGAGSGAISTQDAAAYPGYDRFGRVKRQAWVAGNYDWDGSTTVPQPNRAEHYNSVSIYDRAGNPIRKWNAAKDAGYRPNWTDRDFEYHHDGLDRLTLARRGILIAPGAGMGGTVNLASTNPLAPEITNSLRARGSQKWGLDLLGNWQGFAIDLRTDATDASPNATASGGGFESGEEHARDHDSINQLKGITLPTTPVSVPAGAEFAAGPLFAPMSYVHDDAGSRVKASKLDSGGSPSTSADGRFRFIYDAWNRLVQIDALTGVSGGTESWRKVSRYDFNGLHWRTRKLVYPPSTENQAEERVYTYNAAWQAIAEEIDDDRDTSSSGPGTPRIEHVVQQFFGLGGVNDAVYRRTANLPDGIGYNGTDTVDQAAFFGKCIYQLADSQGSIVAVVSACVMENKGEPSVGIGRTLEGLEYDPYGRSRHTGIAEFNHDGVLDSQDTFDFMTAWFAGNAASDQDQDGTTTVADLFTYLNDWAVPAGTALDELSDRWIDNPYGYCGYYADIETLGINGDHNGFLYHVRHREYDPIAGRWLQRDPAGFVDGMNLYGYYGVDPFGLSCNPDGKNNAERMHDQEKLWLEHTQLVATTDQGPRGQAAQEALEKYQRGKKSEGIKQAASGAKMAIEIAGGPSTNIYHGVNAVDEGNYTEAAKQAVFLASGPALGRAGVIVGEVAEEVGNIARVAEGAVAKEAGAAARAMERAGISELRAAHQAAVKAGVQELEAAGNKVIRDVHFRAPDGTTAVADAVQIARDGSYRVLDWKRGGTAAFTPNQKIVYPAIQRGEAVPFGQRATDAGLSPGQAAPAMPVQVMPY